MKGAQPVKDLLRIDLLRSIEEPLKYLFLEGKDEAEKDPDDEHRRDTETFSGEEILKTARQVKEGEP